MKSKRRLPRKQSANVTSQDPPIRHQDPPVSTLAEADRLEELRKKRDEIEQELRKHEEAANRKLAEMQKKKAEAERRKMFYWDGDLPEHVLVRRQLQPCPSCLRIALDSSSQAVKVRYTTPDEYFFECRACGHRFSLPIQAKKGR